MLLNAKCLALVVSACAALAMPQAAQATITLGTYTSEATLNLNALGTTVQAEDTGGGPTTIGSVSFSNANSVFNNGGFTYGTASFGSAALNSLSNSNALYLTTPETETLSGLITGRDYNLKIILFDGDAGTNSSEDRGFANILFDNGAFDENVTYNYYDVVSGTTGTTEGSPGSFINNKGIKIDYYFTAQSTSLGISLTPASGKYIIPSGFALELIPVPEPGSVSLLALGAVVMLGGSLRRRKLAAK